MDIELEENLVLPAIIDQRAAATPKRLYVVLVDPNPDNPDDLQVRKITYGEFANAVNNAAWWLERTIGKPSVPFETLAYCGLADLRNIIFTLAAVKVGFTVRSMLLFVFQSCLYTFPLAPLATS